MQLGVGISDAALRDAAVGFVAELWSDVGGVQPHILVSFNFCYQ